MRQLTEDRQSLLVDYELSAFRFLERSANLAKKKLFRKKILKMIGTRLFKLICQCLDVQSTTLGHFNWPAHKMMQNVLRYLFSCSSSNNKKLQCGASICETIHKRWNLSKFNFFPKDHCMVNFQRIILLLQVFFYNLQVSMCLYLSNYMTSQNSVWVFYLYSYMGICEVTKKKKAGILHLAIHVLYKLLSLPVFCSFYRFKLQCWKQHQGHCLLSRNTHRPYSNSNCYFWPYQLWTSSGI